MIARHSGQLGEAQPDVLHLRLIHVRRSLDSLQQFPKNFDCDGGVRVLRATLGSFQTGLGDWSWQERRKLIPGIEGLRVKSSGSLHDESTQSQIIRNFLLAGVPVDGDGLVD
jgi:hypothetical protein